MNTVSVRTSRTAGAIGLVEVVGDLDALLTPFWDANRHPSGSCGANPLATSTTDWCTASRKMGAFCFPHAGPMVVRMLVEAFVAQGATAQHARRLPGSGLPNRVVVAGHTGARDQSRRRGPAADPWDPP